MYCLALQERDRNSRPVKTALSFLCCRRAWLPDSDDDHRQTPVKLCYPFKSLKSDGLDKHFVVPVGCCMLRYTTLHYAPLHGMGTGPVTQVDVTRVLLLAGADCDARDNRSRCPLHLAALTGNVELVKALIASGADVQKVSDSGTTALHNAVSAGDFTGLARSQGRGESARDVRAVCARALSKGGTSPGSTTGNRSEGIGSWTDGWCHVRSSCHAGAVSRGSCETVLSADGLATHSSPPRILLLASRWCCGSLAGVVGTRGCCENSPGCGRESRRYRQECLFTSLPCLPKRAHSSGT